MADRGLAGMPMVKLCTSRGWHYLLRVCQEHPCRRFFNGKLEQTWKRFGQIVLKPGYRWYGKARVWQEETLETYVSLVWDTGCEEPSLLISDQGACAWKRPDLIVKAVAGTAKPVGGWTGRTRDRLLLALEWTSHLAAACIQRGQRQRFDRVDRRDKSIFRLGRLWLLDMLLRVRNRASLKRSL